MAGILRSQRGAPKSLCSSHADLRIITALHSTDQRDQLRCVPSNLKTVVFVCTGNFYRSRFSEYLFNALVKRHGLPWRATSRGLRAKMADGEGPLLNSRSPHRELNIFLVDDIQENLELLQDVLAENNYTSVLARNGVEALTKLRHERVHLIVADADDAQDGRVPALQGSQDAPGVRGGPIYHLHRELHRQTDQRLARSIGVDRYVVKYAGLGALVDAVNELVQQRYGLRAVQPVAAAEQIDEHAFLEQHRAIVIRKLEEKMAELEMYADTLVRKNREIQASEERYRALFDHASIAIFVTDHESGRILDANRQALALLGYRKEELLAMPVLPFGAEPGVQKSSVQLYASGESAIQTKSGETIQVDVVVGPVTRPQDPRVMLFVRDVAEKERVQAQLLQAEKLTLMGRLAAGIAHEIRNPLAAVTLNLQYLVGKFGAEADLRQTLDDMLEGAPQDRDGDRQYAEPGARCSPVLELNQLNGLIDQVLRYVKIALQQKRITIEARLDRNIPSISADARQIQQVMINVLQNAIDASPEGSILTVTTGIAVEPRRMGPRAPSGRPSSRYATAVRGSRLITSNRSSNRSGRRKRGGRGWDWRFRSSSWTGTTRKSASSRPSAAAWASSSYFPFRGEGGPNMAKARILVVDDETILSNTLKKILGEQGYEVAVCNRGKEFDERFAAAKPDIVLMDIYMGEVNGIELLQGLRAAGWETPVIIMTAHSDVALAVKAMKEGAADFVVKPFDLNHLSVLIEKNLEFASLQTRVRLLQEELETTRSQSGIIGKSAGIQHVMETAEKFAVGDNTTVLIEGESGTGKELVARFLHKRSDRAERPMVTVNCRGRFRKSWRRANSSATRRERLRGPRKG